MNYEELCQKILDKGYDSVELFSCDDFAEAFIGLTDTLQAVYSYEDMIAWKMEKYDIEADEAEDDICYNSLRLLYYRPSNIRPIVVCDTVFRYDNFSNKDIEEYLNNGDEERNVKLLDEAYSEAFLGLAYCEEKAVYSYKKLIECVIANSNPSLTVEQAEEYIEKDLDTEDVIIVKEL